MRLVHIDLGISDPFTRGLSHGRELREHVETAASAYLAMFRRLGVAEDRLRELAEGTISALESWRPEFATELRGISEGSGVSLHQIALLNARTEALANVTSQHECSTVAVTDPTRSPLAAQTWDWHASLAPIGVIARIETSLGRRIVTFAEPGTLAKIGVSDAGVGVHFNILHHQSDGSSIGVPVHAIARAMLEEASSVEEAIAIAEGATIGASTVCTVLTRGDRDARSIELSPAAVRAVAPTRSESGRGVLVHTNHFLDPVLAAGNRNDPTSTTHERFDFLSNNLQSLASAETSDSLVQKMCGGISEPPICIRPQPELAAEDQWETLLTVAIDVDRASLTCVAGGPGDFASAQEWTA